MGKHLLHLLVSKKGFTLLQEYSSCKEKNHMNDMQARKCNWK